MVKSKGIKLLFAQAINKCPHSTLSRDINLWVFIMNLNDNIYTTGGMW
jgi:hypothetical protein